MTKLGLPEADAITVATLMAQADLQGSDGHGVSRLPQYARRIKAGGFNVKPNSQVVQERAGMALLNGDNGMGHLVMKRAAEMAIEKARVTGIAWVSSQFSNHAGPASLYATMPLKHDMIGLYCAVGNANHLPPWGGLDMLLSTNPIAAAIPAGEEKPIVLDMATTVAAYGKVKTKALRGETMPVGWMIDRLGKPLTDPKRADEGMLLPLGGMEAGYKGYGLAMIIGLLAGTLGGAAMGKDVIDFNHDDESKWEVPSDIPRFSGVLSTAGGVVFSGQLTGEFEAFDANDGKKLWQFQTGSGIEGQPVTWQQDGVQYVAVTSGYGGVYSL